ncbi:MAG: hypothetical protein JSR34_06395 [Proteobacteria bacterium]|nr:hypothetical protein [Pseudomonadota bacterium]
MNRTIYDARGLEAFCIRQYRASNLTVSESLVQLQGLINFQVALWADSTVKVRKKALAPDLLDKEIATIEAYLDPKVRCATVGPQIAARDYLIWRLTIEFGVRIGEVLALRIQDCPSRGKPYFQIVRIDERDSQFDPRHPYAPRPKTLSRELGFVLSNTRFPGLSLDYISQHRFKMIELRGRMIKKFNVGHDFLIVAQGGEPLSLSSTKRIAAEIRKHTGIDFHWHLARHAFFNRAMEGVRRARDRDDEIARRADLCFWGGWERESSLDIYTRRIRRDAMRQGLAIWQLGENTWGALN